MSAVLVMAGPISSPATDASPGREAGRVALPVRVWCEGVLLDDTPHDLGELRRGHRARRKFLIENTSGESLALTASSCCGKFTFQEDKLTIPPYGSHRWRFEVRADRLRGRHVPTVVGKKNYLFFGHPEAGQRSVVLYTILETCRRHGINPWDYLRDVLTRLPSMTNQQTEQLTRGNRLASRRAAQAAQGLLRRSSHASPLRGIRSIPGRLHRIDTVTTPESSPGAGDAQTTDYGYDERGRIELVHLPDGNTQAREYFLTGELKSVSGGRTYPVDYTYDSQGRRNTMTTWQDYAGQQGAATTTWHYDTETGRSERKEYQDGKDVDYTYKPSGRLRTRTWERGVTTIYSYDEAGGLETVVYSDATPSVAYAYDRLGQATNVVDGAGTHAMTYGQDGLLATWELPHVGGSAGIAYGYDGLGRRETMGFSMGPTQQFTHTLGYDAAGRVQSVSDGTRTAWYEYLPDSGVVERTIFTNSTTHVMTTTRAYDDLSRLTSTSTTRPDTSVITSHAYSAYDAANQRRRADLEDESFWLYDYDDLGQLTSAKRFWPDETPVAGQQFEYAYDDIGNREWTRSGGDETGQSLRQSTYTANLVNQYIQRTVPGYVDVMGEAEPDAVVTVNDQATIRQGPQGDERYWRGELAIDNAGGAVDVDVDVVGVWNPPAQGVEDVVTEESGREFVPANPEGFVYDEDGNLTEDGRWTYEWDAENRLVAMETRAALASTVIPDPVRIEFEYDYRWRRTRKTVKNAQTGQPISSTKYVWDGWLLIAELDALNNDAVLRSYLWGLDLSGSTEAAGGIGGLLAMTTSSGDAYFYAYDGNGNVVRLIDATDPSTPAGTYIYEPYGAELVSTGLAAEENPFRFSTKLFDPKARVGYWGYRYCMSELGRFVGRDPEARRHACEAYTFCANQTQGRVDPLGLEWHIVRTKSRARAIACASSAHDSFDGLASRIQLDAKDHRKWARTDDADPVRGKIYLIPNTIYIDQGQPREIELLWGGWASFVGRWRERMQKQRTRWEQQGFRVEVSDGVLGTEILEHLRDPDLYGYVYVGHGAEGAIINTKTYGKRGEEFAIGDQQPMELLGVPPDRYTRHGVAFLYLHACFTASREPVVGRDYTYNAWESNVSTLGWFGGYEGSVDMINSPHRWRQANGKNDSGFGMSR